MQAARAFNAGALYEKRNQLVCDAQRSFHRGVVARLHLGRVALSHSCRVCATTELGRRGPSSRCRTKVWRRDGYLHRGQVRQLGTRLEVVVGNMIAKRMRVTRDKFPLFNQAVPTLTERRWRCERQG